MAESSAYVLACNVFSTITSPPFVAAYEKGLFIWKATDELSKIQHIIKSIRDVLLDAEKKQEDSTAVKDWIKRVKGVLYDADDLFDEIVTRYLIEQQMRKGNQNPVLKKVLVSTSKFNQYISRYSIGKKVKVIRKSFDQISIDLVQFGFMRSQYEEPRPDVRTGQDLRSSVDVEAVIGERDDMEIVLEMLFSEPNDAEQNPLVIAITGTGAAGKTTLASHIYKSDKVKRHFDNQAYVSISQQFLERDVLQRIFQSISAGDHTSSSASQLQTRIRNSINGKKFLLVLDDVWEGFRDLWQDQISLFSGCAKGSRIIVTTRLQSVVSAVNAVRVHSLRSYSEDEEWTWDLFKRLTFAPGYENDPVRIQLGREILKKCRGLPLVIKVVSGLLTHKHSILEWEEIERESLRVTNNRDANGAMRMMKLCYDYLPPNLKHCFAYCSIFPKDYKLVKHELIYLWNAQGFIQPGNEESCFMHLSNFFFLKETEKDEFGKVNSYRMHDLVHDLALHVSGAEKKHCMVLHRGTRVVLQGM